MAIQPANSIAEASLSLAESFTPSLDRACGSYRGPRFGIRFWDESVWKSPGDAGNTAYEFWLRNHDGLRALLERSEELAVSEAFIEGDLYINGDLFEAVRAWPRVSGCMKADHVFDSSIFNRFVTQSADSYDRFLHFGLKHSKARDKAGSTIFEQSPEFYRQFLGNSLLYSCGLFSDGKTTLEAAQARKLAVACAKLDLRPGTRYLDIGCGWGSAALYAAKRFSVRAYGITLNCTQARLGNEMAEQAGLSSSCQIDQRDYRDLDVIHLPFDRISGAGVTESVGQRNIDEYFRTVFNTLTSGGLFLNESLTRSAAGAYPFEAFDGARAAGDHQRTNRQRRRYGARRLLASDRQSDRQCYFWYG